MLVHVSITSREVETQIHQSEVEERGGTLVEEHPINPDLLLIYPLAREREREVLS